MLSFEDKLLIKTLWECKGFSSRRLIKEFPNKNLTMGFIIVTPRVRRAPLDGTARFSVCVCVETTVITTKVKKQLLLTESQSTTTQNKQ